MKQKRMIELFSGTGRMAESFRKRGWRAVTVDIEFKADFRKDILTMSRNDIVEMCGGEPDVIWMSPPCTGFSVASIGHHWGGGYRAYQPKTDTAKLGLALAQKCREIINWFPDAKFAIENPRGVLRKLPVFLDLDRRTVTYCQYGEARMKPTDLWTNLEVWAPRSACKNGMSCHVAAPRGSQTGTQGMKNAYERGALPIQLCDEFSEACDLWIQDKKA